MEIESNLRSIRSVLPSHIRLVAVSKTHPPEEMMKAYRAGQRAFGENRVQEMASKQPQMPADVEWHFIGHLQTNKVRFIAPFVSLVHSVDSLRLLTELNGQALKHKRIIGCLLQFHIAREETKYGLSEEEAMAILESDEVRHMEHARILGVMGMATLTEDTGVIRNEFRNLKGIFDRLKERYFRDASGFREISMGMSSDYPVAVEEGATIVRIGSLIFDKVTTP